jgi:hypothetical protein
MISSKSIPFATISFDLGEVDGEKLLLPIDYRTPFGLSNI